MEDEVAKHGKKLIKAARNSKHTLPEKLREIGTEIGIIVFAISLSIWLHSWSEHRHEQKEVSEFLTGLKADLEQDIRLLEDNKRSISRLHANFSFLLAFENGSGPKQDSIVSSRLFFDLRSTRPNIGRYQGFKSSGKIGTIKNDSLKQNILVFYEQTLPDLNYGEDYVNGLQSRILDWQIDQNGHLPVSELVMSPKMKSLFSLGSQNFGVNISAYDKSIAQAKKIVAEIDRELR